MVRRFTSALLIGATGTAALMGLILWLLMDGSQRNLPWVNLPWVNLPWVNLPWVAAILPVLPGLVMIAAVLAAFPSMDELERRVHVEGMFMGFGLSLLLFFGVGVMQTFAEWPQLNLALAAATMTACWGIGVLVGWRRYR